VKRLKPNIAKIKMTTIIVMTLLKLNEMVGNVDVDVDVDVEDVVACELIFSIDCNDFS
jgi:hypothetical protein